MGVVTVRAVRLLTALVMAAGLPVMRAPAQAAPRASGWMLTRIGSPGPLEMNVSPRAWNAEATFTVYALRRVGARYDTDPALGRWTVWGWGKNLWVRTYGVGVSTPPCPASAFCTDPVQLPTVAEGLDVSTSGRKLRSTVYVAAWGGETTLTIRSPGWRKTPWEPPMRVWTTADGGGSGVHHLGSSTGTFRKVEAVGGRYGSLAGATIPCGFQREYGQATFAGGNHTRTISCADDFAAGWQTSSTTRWRFEGDVAGVAASQVVLFVIDYPRP